MLIKVRYYCGNNVIDWYADNHITHDVTYTNSYFGKDIDMATSLIHQPALYDAQGFKLAECSTNYEENGVTKQIQVLKYSNFFKLFKKAKSIFIKIKVRSYRNLNDDIIV